MVNSQFQTLDSLVNHSKSRFAFLFRLLMLAGGMTCLSLNLIFQESWSSTIAAVAAIVLSGYLLFLSNHNRGLLIVFGYLFLSVYSSCVVNYFGLNLSSRYQQWIGTEVSSVSINVLLIFLLCITNILPIKIGPFPDKKLIQAEFQNNDLIVIACAIGFLLSGLFGVGTQYAASDRMSISSIYEYSIAFLIIGLYFSGGTKSCLSLLAVVSIIRIGLDFYIGARITSIEIITIWYLMVFAAEIKLRSLIPVTVVAFIVMLTVGELRGSAFDASAITNGITDYMRSGFAWDGAYAAYHTSESMVAYRDLTIEGADLSDFFGYLYSLIGGDSAGYIGLQYEMAPYYWNMGGGYLPFFFYYYLGYPGVIISSIIIGCVLRYFTLLSEDQDATDVARFAYIWICATCYRWLSYSASPLIRGLLIVLIAFLIISILAKINPTILRRRV